MEADEKQIAAYLRKLRWSLAALPGRDIDEIVEETRSHLLDRVEAGASTAEAIASIGAAEDYARQFVREHAASHAMATRRASDFVGALVANAAGSALAVGLLAAIFVLWTLVLTIASIAAMKIANPDTVGLWVGGGDFFIGIINDPSSAREVLGVWIFPIAFGLFVAAIFVTKRLAGSALRRLIGAA